MILIGARNWRQGESGRWLRLIVIGAAVLIFFAQAFFMARYFDVTMDEGTYLLKGFLFLKGDYQPFEDYGLWTNKMPLAFYIPGLAQYLFMPGLQTGRYFSIFLSALMLIGLWLTVRRNAGKNWAAVVLLVFALNTGTAYYYMQAITQVITAMLLAWALYFLLGEGRTRLELGLGALLMVMVVFTRQNLLPVLPFACLFIFWQHGWKRGWPAVLGAVVVFAGLHLPYWPNIARTWLEWLPGSVKRWIGYSTLFPSAGVTPIARQKLSFWSRFFVFWETYRIFFALQAGALLAVLAWPRKGHWKSSADFKSAVFCGVNFLVLLVIHFWASLLRDECVYCYPGYLAFFLPFGILFVVLCLKSARRQLLPVAQGAGALLMLASAAGLGYSVYKPLQWVVDLQVPRVRDLRIQPGTIELWRLLSNKFGWAYDVLERLLPAVFGLACGGLILLAVWSISRWGRRKYEWKHTAWYAALAILFAGNVILSIPYPGGAKSELNCGSDILASHEQVGQYLKSVVPAGSLVYWENDVTPLPLIYIPDVRVFPGQLNHHFSKVVGGDLDIVARKGFWNDELAARWALEADYLLIADSRVERLMDQGILTREMDEIGESPITSGCRDKSTIHVYKAR